MTSNAHMNSLSRYSRVCIWMLRVKRNTHETRIISIASLSMLQITRVVTEDHVMINKILLLTVFTTCGRY
jgi:hypothetical protein